MNRYRGRKQAHTRGKDARDDEHGRREPAQRESKPPPEEIVRSFKIAPVIGGDKEEAYEYPPREVAEHELEEMQIPR